MKLIWKILIGFGSVLLVLYIISLFLPNEFDIERSVTIDAPASVVFDEVTDLRGWPAWSPFELQDTAVSATYSANSRGANAWIQWTDSQRRDGRITIVSIAEENQIDLAIEFGEVEPEPGPANSTLQFVAQPAGTQIVWHFHGEAFTAVDRYLALFVEGQMGERFENSLQVLKQRVEERLAK